MSDTQKSIVGGMTILSVVGVICKIVGALYRIPLAWLIGEQGMGTYQLVFPTYNMLLTISSAGCPSPSAAWSALLWPRTIHAMRGACFASR